MLALFIATTIALCLLGWAEGLPRQRQVRAAADTGSEAATMTAAPAQVAAPNEEHAAPDEDTNDLDAAVMMRIEALLAHPNQQAETRAKHTPAPAPAAGPEPLPRINGFEPGDAIALDFTGSAPRRDDITFRTCAEGTLVVIEGQAELVITGIAPEQIAPDAFQFRAHAAA
ncbi:hypothetical protein BMI86_15510 [Thioclava sp. DLFJ5-1]|uniref:hypothetical protein n=1 Tax=Thioclava sp. DLFJ5-1 TaxID=1915314 RepID=UPI000997A9A9|nr:hypothetical protein [Thioclava sp. DLFJ5-1]OOY19233.1 hypothetical protein BMI86_15510 [Thioclava sp. DLFJ5-1]